MTNAIRFWKSGPRPYRDIIKQADAARDAKDLPAAARLYRQAVASGAPSGIRKQLANMLKDSGSYDEALFHYHLCLEDDPDDSDTLLQLGHLHKLQKQYAKAGAITRGPCSRPAPPPMQSASLTGCRRSAGLRWLMHVPLLKRHRGWRTASGPWM